MRPCIVWKFACRTVAFALAGSSIGNGVAARGIPQFARAVVAGEARVIDGDTIQVAGVRIRLEGIDAPETGQSCQWPDGSDWNCGNVASAELEKLVRGQTVSCDPSGLDKYGRTLAICFVAEHEINAAMVERGLAWAFVRYSTRYVATEAAAREARVGIWHGAATPAWSFREQLWSQAVVEAPHDCAIKGNSGRKGLIYHMPWSPWYRKVRMDNGARKRWFCSESEAVQAGFRPALWR